MLYTKKKICEYYEKTSEPEFQKWAFDLLNHELKKSV